MLDDLRFSFPRLFVYMHSRALMHSVRVDMASCKRSRLTLPSLDDDFLRMARK